MLHTKFCGNRPVGSGDVWRVLTILLPTSNWSLNFDASSESKSLSYKIHASINKPRLCLRLCLWYFPLKMTCTGTSRKEEVKGIDTLFSKNHIIIFFNMRIFQRDLICLHFCLFKDVTHCRHLRRISFITFCFNLNLRFLPRKSMNTSTLSSWIDIVEIQL